MAASEWNVPLRPVKPWQMTLVFLSTRIAMSGRLDRLDDLLRRVIEIVGGDHVELGLGNDALAEIDVGAFEPYHQRHLEADLFHRRDDAFGDDVAAHDAAENIDQDYFHARIGREDLERGRDRLLAWAATDVK